MPKNYGIGFVSEHPELSSKQLAEILGVTTRTIRNYKKTIRSSGAEIKSTAEREVMRNRQDRALRQLKVKYDSLLNVLQTKSNKIAAYQKLSGAPTPIKIQRHQQAKYSVVPVIVASDWHIEQTVSPEITNGLNSYNSEIAKDSIKQFFNNACTLVRQTKQNNNVNTIVLALLGDIINGVLRSQDLESNSCTSIDALITARAFLHSGIKLLAEDTGCKLKILCCVGNHGRTTDKIHYSNQVHNSLEYLLYKTLEGDFSQDENIEFVVSQAPYIIQSIYGIRIRFHHGHIARYHGGIGGLAVPVLRKVAQMNTVQKADMDVIGHFHSMQVFSNVLINGSLVGSNGFSMACGFPYEPPQQLFFLIDSKHGRSMITPIYIDRKSESNKTSDIQ